MDWLNETWEAFLGFWVYDPARPMLFNSEGFLFSFLACLSVYLLIYKNTWLRVSWLTLYSLFFYYKSGGMYVFLLLFSILVNYLLALQLDKAPTDKLRKRWLIAAVTLNLGALAWFKYSYFFLSTAEWLFRTDMPHPDIWLPIGISFYTFQVISYIADIHRRQMPPITNLLDFVFYVSFFPHSVAGPIMRAKEFAPQIRQTIQLSSEDLGRGLLLICAGLFKKAVISDYISSNFVDRVFETPALFSGFENLMAVYGYALQIYCDFSGYSDMAIGLGLLMGYRLPLNFRTPYQSASIQEFWRRWHISLSSWLRDYLYIALGGNRRGRFFTYLNLLITMLLGGLWHGGAWRFVLWGALHGVALVMDRMMRDIKEAIAQRYVRFLDSLDRWEVKRDKLGDPKPNEWITRLQWITQGWLALILSVLVHMGGVFFTFHFVCFCWIFFRVESFDLAGEMLYQILRNFHGELAWKIIADFRPVFLMMLLGYFLHFLPEDLGRWVQQRFNRLPVPAKAVIVALFIWFTLLAGSAGEQPFIYYQF
ncbi:MAG: MBOAT family protein [Bacteroidetes bacterium]|jgi:alginate O-acetyltransferase complex protein AlgI|nr:MAG: MBOAT family protein [Bacteroidota bacterium]